MRQDRLQGTVPNIQLYYSTTLLFLPTRLHSCSQKNILKIFSQRNKPVNGGGDEGETKIDRFTTQQSTQADLQRRT